MLGVVECRDFTRNRRGAKIYRGSSHHARSGLGPVRYLIHNAGKSSPDPAADAARLQDSCLEAFHTLVVPVLYFDHDGHIIHKVRCIGPDLFRKKEQLHDWIFVRRRGSSPNKIPGSLDGRVPAQLNPLFKLREPTADNTYRLADISLLKIIGSQTPDGPEGMSLMGCPITNHVIRITDIEGMAHLIAIEPDQLWLVNNRIDQQTWNDIHDGNGEYFYFVLLHVLMYITK